MKTITLLLIAVCFAPVLAYQQKKDPYEDIVNAATTPRRRTTKRRQRKAPPAKPGSLDDLFDPYLVPLVDKNGWAFTAENVDCAYRYRPGKTISVSPTVRQIWLKVTFTDIEKARVERAARYRQSIGAGSEDHSVGPYARFTYMLELNEVDCQRRQLRLLRLVDYDSSGAILGDQSIDDAMSVAIPGSVGESVIETACADK
jgi:hypothetical protein